MESEYENAVHRSVATHAEAPRLYTDLQTQGRKLPAHSRKCKCCGSSYTQYPHPLLELQDHTQNHMCLVLYAGLLQHMLKLPASQSCNLLIHRTGRYRHI
ncbi:uncharacterized protein LOC142585216 isoform X4 [Dermacentor variabilis]|uniref:uncharacterized protein LOC142585216 isoform X4 n=1 Tax=Dermacentor variabilis TaxID=34621 RepID=UPI003F5B21EE